MIKQFLTSISFHGFAHLFAPRISYLEKIYWFLCMTGSVAAWAFFTYIVITDNSLINVAYQETAIPVSQIPFPSVTFCPSVAVLGSTLVPSITDKDICLRISDFGEISWQECYLLEGNCKDVSETRYNNMSFSQFYDRIHSLYKNSILRCFVDETEFDCAPYFKEVKTRRGICLFFNAATSGSGEYKNSQKTAEHANLQRNLKPNLMLTFLLSASFSKDPRCDPVFRGYMLSLGAPDDVPSTTSTDLKLLFGQHTMVDILPEIATAAEDSIKLRHERRFCHMPTDFEMKYFPYTERNCLLECVIDEIVKICRCVLHYIPQLWNIKLCTLKDSPCIEEVIILFPRKEDPQLQHDKCKCVACEKVSYQARAYYGKFTKYFRGVLEQNNCSYKESAVVSIFTRKVSILGLHRSQKYDIIDLFASLGGLLGLFMGISLLCPAEIVYLYFLKPLRTRTRH